MNKDETLSFTDYISRKTSFEKTDVSQNSLGAQDDILAEFVLDLTIFSTDTEMFDANNYSKLQHYRPCRRRVTNEMSFPVFVVHVVAVVVSVF